MSLLNTGPLQVAPLSTGAPTVTAGTAWVYGAWVEVIAVAPTALTIAGLFLQNGVEVNRVFDVDLGIGGVGAEVSLGTPIRLHVALSTFSNSSYMLPVPIAGLIPAGSRVSLRLRAENNALTFDIGLHYYTDTFTSTIFTTAWPTKAAPEAANAVTVTTPASAWTNSPWGELAAGLARDAYVYGLTWRISLSQGAAEIDLGTGAAAAEVVQTTVRLGLTTLDNKKLAVEHLPALVKIQAATRIAFRVRTSSALAKSCKSSLVYLDALTPLFLPPWAVKNNRVIGPPSPEAS